MTNRRTFLGYAAAAAGAAALPASAHAQSRAATVKTKDTELHVKDWGAGRPVILTHAWPLSADIWDADCGARERRLSRGRLRPARLRAIRQTGLWL